MINLNVTITTFLLAFFDFLIVNKNRISNFVYPFFFRIYEISLGFLYIFLLICYKIHITYVFFIIPYIIVQITEPFFKLFVMRGVIIMLKNYSQCWVDFTHGRLNKNQTIVFVTMPIWLIFWIPTFVIRMKLTNYYINFRDNNEFARLPMYYFNGYVTYWLVEQYTIYTPHLFKKDVFILIGLPVIIPYLLVMEAYKHALKAPYDAIQPFEVFLDSAEVSQYGFQDSATGIMEGIINLHDHIFFFLIIISTGVLWMMGVILKFFAYSKNIISHKYLVHGTAIEIIWTITPAFILISIAFPSFKLLYMMDEVVDPGLTFKAIGHQWYWSYEFSDYVNDNSEAINFDSYMVPTDELIKGDLRLLEVDNRIILPINTPIRVIITAADVLHAWAVPSLGVKLDAVPGRLNQTSMFIKREGLYYGQCSELCGVQHGFMPIVIRGVSIQKFFSNLLECIEVYKK